MKNIIITLTALITSTFALYAQHGTLDFSFDPGAGLFSGVANDIQFQNDGKIIIGGTFTKYDNIDRNRIVRVNTDGSIDNSFSPEAGFNDAVHSIAVQSDGKTIVGGLFSQYSGTTRYKLARLNTDGSLDSTFDPGNMFQNGYVRKVLILSDGKVVVSGGFSVGGGTLSNNVIILNSDGSHYAGFDVGTGASHAVYTMALQPDDKILIGGAFTTVNGVTCNRLARLNMDGSVDGGFNTSSGANGVVNDIVLAPTGKMYIIGEFTTYNNTNRKHVCRVNSDGSIDASFEPEDVNYNNGIEAIALQADGKILIGGSLTQYGSEWTNRLIRINEDGSLDNTFDAGGEFGANGTVGLVKIDSDNRIYISGVFDSYSDTSRKGIARLLINELTSTGDLNENSRIKLFPNPAKDIVVIDKIPTGSKVIVSDMTGKFLYSEISIETKLPLNVSGYQNGIYLIVIEHKGSISNKMLVVYK